MLFRVSYHHRRNASEGQMQSRDLDPSITIVVWVTSSSLASGVLMFVPELLTRD
ncbi:hypothetical protein NG799_08990 [Laspinema sp. D1]|uniref:Uncharacterized protein n=1 Tax=Laspinema palackyanum D2a TaxID=2953684 RepID=A0ABT2MRB5_9CYAN|nr:hypothetical protein [Laspinema sp. D2a]